MAHTPGPWTAEDPKDAQYDILGPRGEHVVCFGHEYDHYGCIANESDRSLIAAAPDLLDACRRALDEAGHLQGVTRRGALAAAIAKAEGR